MEEHTANIMKVAHFEDGETLSTPHFVVDAKVEDSKNGSKGTFLLPSMRPEASYRDYAVVLDECTGIYHVARKGTIVYKDPTAVLKTKLHKSTPGRRFKKTMKEHDTTVEMPSDFEATLKENYTNLPKFGCFPEELSPPLQYSKSINAKESLQSLSAEVPGPVDAVFSKAEQGAGGPTLSSDEQDVAFFKSLLFKKDIPEEATSALMPSTRPTGASDKKFFESLLTPQEQAQDEHSANALVDKSIEASVKLASTLAQKHALTATWIDINKTDLAGVASFLDLAVLNLSTEPRHLLSELSLDVTPDQACLLTENGGTDVFKKSATEVDHQSSVNDTVHYFVPDAPRKDAMTYEEYFPLCSPSSSEYSATTAASADSAEGDDDSTITSSTLTSDSKDDLALVLKKKPLTESAWLDLAQCFHDSAIASCNDLVSIPKSTEVDQDSSSRVPVVRLPCIDHRQTCLPEMQEDDCAYSTVPCKDEANPLSVEDDDSIMQIHVSAAPVDADSAITEQPKEAQNNALDAAIKALDDAAVFGGKAYDWSDDDEFCTTSPGTEYESEIVAHHTSADPGQTPGNDAPKASEPEGDNALDQVSEVESAEPLSGTVVATTDIPNHTCYRLPAAMIEAINLEYIRLRSLETPENFEGDDEKVYEQALANIKGDYDDIPDDILFWVSEVNSEFGRLCSEGQRDGGAWELNYQFEQVVALALSNVEWHYFGHLLKESRPADFVQQVMVAADSPKVWLMDVPGGDTDCPGYRFRGTATSEEEETAANQYDTRGLHHINFNGDYVYERSCTPPAVSYWAIRTTRYKQLRYTDSTSKAVPAVHLKSVLSAQAFKYVDPVQQSGTNADTPTDTAGSYLTGSHLQDAVIGDIEVIYQPWGSWWEDDYSENEVIPQQSMQGDEFHQASMPEYIFLQRPYYMDSRDQQHDLLKFNGQPHINPLLVSRRPLKHNGVSPLTQVWCMNDLMQETPDEKDIHVHEQAEDLADQVSPSPIDLDEIYRDSEAINNNDRIFGTESKADETVILEAAWDAWKTFDQDSEVNIVGEEGVSDAQMKSTHSRPLSDIALAPLNEYLGDDDNEISMGVAAPVTPDLLLRLPNSMDSHKYTEEVYAPVTPALLLRLPNGAIELKDQMLEFNDDEDVRDAEMIDDNVSEADTEIEDAETLHYHSPTEYKLHKGRNFELQAEESLLPSRDGRHIDAEKMMSSIIGTFCQRQISAGDDFDDFPKVSMGDSFSGSKLRPHRFFNIIIPELLAPTMDLFAAQNFMQTEIEKSIEDLPCFSPEVEAGQWTSAPEGLML